MKRIGLMSDTHGWFDPKLYDYFKDVDEIWHAGDIGTIQVVRDLQAFKPLKAVYGNIDGKEIRAEFDEDYEATIEGVRVWMTHIGGYPGRYSYRVNQLLQQGKRCDLFICGHSHILKVMKDNKYGMMTMNPGACGFHGFHVFKTLLRFGLDKGKIVELEAIELGKRGELSVD